MLRLTSMRDDDDARRKWMIEAQGGKLMVASVVRIGI